VCGRAPAAHLSVTSNQGLVFVSRRRTVTGTFCRDCGLSVFRTQQRRTLLVGWWSFVAVIYNWIVLIQNVDERRRALALPEPTGPALAPRLRPVAPVWKSPGAVLTGAGLALFAILLVAAAFDDRDSSRDVTSVAQAFEGDCVDIRASDAVDAASCDGPHDGKVVVVVAAGERCPAETDQVVLFLDTRHILCIDPSK